MAKVRGRRRSAAWGARWDEAEARQVLKAWRGSGLSLTEWTQRESLGYERVARWNRLLSKAAAKRARTAKVLPVQVIDAAAPTNPPGFELELPRGVRVQVPPTFEGSSLRRLLHVLEERS